MSNQSNYSGIPLKSFYRPEDAQGAGYGKALNDPGQYPYTRGTRTPDPARAGFIERELSGEGDPRRSNEQFKYLLEKGQTGLDVIGDAPTMSWLDPDHPLAAKAVGAQGVSLCRLEDYRELYQGIPLDAISISNSLPAPFAIAALYQVARESGVPPSKLRGSVVQFVLYGEDCGYSIQLPLELRLRLAVDCIEFCTREMPRFHAFLEDTYYISEAGLDSVEEMALGFVEIRYVVRELLRRGAGIDTFAPRIAILLNCRMDFFEEIAKIRATRRLFARMMKEEFAAVDPRSMAVVIASHTSGLTMTAQQPFNNISRGALQALSLALAGVQAIEISAFDEAYRTPTPESHLVGLRTQQVIQLESNVTKVADPLGGSYYVEALTDDMEKRIREMVLDIESRGDPGDLVDSGWFRALFVNAMERYSGQLQNGEVKQVGVNVHQIPEEEDTLLKEIAETKVEPSWERIETIRDHRVNRDGKAVGRALNRLHRAALDREENLLYPIVEATQAGATMGEMAGVMRQGYGQPHDPFNMATPPAEFTGQAG